MARRERPTVLRATVDGETLGLFVGERGGIYARLNGRPRRVAEGVCAVPVGPRDQTGIAQGVYWSGQPIPIHQLNERPNLFWPNRYRSEPWAPDGVWIDSEKLYREIQARARRPRPPRLKDLPMVWEDLPETRRRVAIQPRDLEIFRHLDRFGVQISDRLAYEFFPGRDLTSCQRRLKALTEAGYLMRGRPQLSRGSVAYVYRLTKAGFEAGQAAYDDERKPYVPLDRTWTGRAGGGAQSVEHDLRAGGAILELAAIARGLGLEAEVFGPLDSRCDVPTVYDSTERRRARATMGEFGRTGIHDLRLGLKFRDVVPDGSVRLLAGHDPPREILVEFDRTARPSKNAPKLHGYDSFLSVWWAGCERLEGHAQPMVLFVCTSETVVGSFLELAASELTGWRRGDGDRRLYPGRRSLAFCTEEALYEDGSVAEVHFVDDGDGPRSVPLEGLFGVANRPAAERRVAPSAPDPPIEIWGDPDEALP